MATNSPNKGYVLPATSDFVDTWGVQLDSNVFSIVDLNLGGRLSKAVGGSSNVILSSTETRNAYITLTGVLTGNIDLQFPATAGGFWIINNTTTGSFTITVKPTGGTGVVITQSQVSFIFINPDATTAVFAATPGTVSGVVSIAHGGTGAITAALAATALGLGTGDSPQFTGINVGAATDTTITRSSAGVIAVEGNTVAMRTTTNTFTAAQTVSVASGVALTLINAAGGVGSTQQSTLTADSTSGGAVIGGFSIQGKDDGGNNTTYAQLLIRTDGVVDGSESGYALWRMTRAGVATDVLNIGNGVLVGTATGSTKGANTFNCATIYENGTSLVAKYSLIAGSSSITTVGTITSGTWTGTTIAVANGGTGSTTAANARTALGLAIGTNVQAWDAQLDDIAALAVTDSNFIVGNGSNWVAESGATARTSLGLGTSATVNTGTSGATIPLLNGANTWSGNQTISVTGGAVFTVAGTASSQIIIDGAAAQVRVLQFGTAGDARWKLFADSTAESGANAGSNLTLTRYTDAGASIASVFTIVRSTGATTWTPAFTVSGTFTANDLNSNSVAITGGTITGITDLAVVDGGTGSSSASGARTNLGLGTADSPQFTAINLNNASDTTVTRVAGGGQIAVEGNTVYMANGTDVAVADGGTGASSAAAACDNLGLGTLDTPQFAAVNIGNSSDTTITRVSAGVIAVEGSTIISGVGSTAITTLGTITTGTWSATTVALNKGGTGSTTAPGARTNLGLGTAAVEDIGTSGATVPLLSTINTWSGIQQFKQDGVHALKIDTSSGSSPTTLIDFYTGNFVTVIGSISTNGTNTTNYNTTSDVRLKTDMAELSVSDKFDSLNPVEFTWEATGEKSVGLVAQELYEICPEAVRVGGDDPDLDPWMIDYSKMVPTLIAELKALRARVAVLEGR